MACAGPASGSSMFFLLTHIFTSKLIHFVAVRVVIAVAFWKFVLPLIRRVTAAWRAAQERRTQQRLIQANNQRLWANRDVVQEQHAETGTMVSAF